MSLSVAVPNILLKSSKKKVERHEAPIARLTGAGTAGIAEVVVFHPVDTIAKRLMSHQGRVRSVSQLDAVIFRNSPGVDRSVKNRFLALFPGLGYATGYKVLQRAYKYGGQPIVRNHLNKHHGSSFDRVFGSQHSKAVMHAVSGSIIGIGEVVLLPLDVLKIKRQTNPGTFYNRLSAIIRKEKFGLYRGWSWTAARNAMGSFALFGGHAAAKQYIFGLEDFNSATTFQNFVAAAAGSCASLLVSGPVDVVKTRIQSQNFGVKVSGAQVIAGMLRNEGPTALLKGLVPKLLTTGPKITFSFWLAQTLMPAFEKAACKTESNAA